MAEVTAPYLRAVPLHEEQASPYIWLPVSTWGISAPSGFFSGFKTAPLVMLTVVFMVRHRLRSSTALSESFSFVARSNTVAEAKTAESLRSGIASCLAMAEDELRAMGAAAHDSMVRLGITKDAFANQRVEVYDDV